MRCKDNGKNGIRLQFFGKKDFFCYFCPELIQRFMAIIILLLYAALVFLTIKFKQTYTPAGVMVFLWTALNATLLIFFRDMVELKYSGLFYILAGVGVFFGGAILGQKTNKQNLETNQLQVNEKMIAPILCILTLLGFIWPVYYIIAHGFSISNLFDLDELGEMTKAFSQERYTTKAEDEIGYSRSTQLLLVFTYSAPIFGGFCWLITHKLINKVLCIITNIPCLLVTASQSTKMTLMCSLIFWIAGFLTYSLSYKIKLTITLKKVLISIGLLALFFAALFYSQLTRWGNNYDDNKIELNKISFFDYAFGSLMCFDDWFYSEINNIDYSTTLLQNSKIYRLGYLSKIDNGVKVEFSERIHAPLFEIYGRQLNDCEYLAGNNYTVSFDLTSDVQPDSVKYSIFSTTTIPKGHLPLMIDSCKQTGLHTWHYQLSINLDSNRFMVRTPDIILSYDSVKYVKITKFRIDTGSVAQPWVNGDNNIFWHNDQLKYGVMTFCGLFNGLGLAKRQKGIYRDYVYFGRLDKTMHSNVYSIFRYLIDDFGTIGALFFLAILGFLSSKAIRYVIQGKMIYISQVYLIAIFSYILWGFVAPLWAYTSIICAYGLAFLIFSILQKPLHGDTWVTKIAKILKPKQK